MDDYVFEHLNIAIEPVFAFQCVYGAMVFYQ